MLRPDYKQFKRLTQDATLVPISKSVTADLLTPVSAFLAVAADEPGAFLLESVEGGEKIGRYTFLGVRPYMQVQARGSQITIKRGKTIERQQGNIFQIVRRLLHLFENPKHRDELRSGRLRFRLAPVAMPGSAQPAHRVEKGAVTEAMVAAAAKEGARLVLGPRAVLTPLGRDRARAAGVEIVKER